MASTVAEVMVAPLRASGGQRVYGIPGDSLNDAQPGEALPLALAGFFQARLGEDADAALAKLDQAAATDLGLPQYFRGLALAGLPPDRRRAARAVLRQSRKSCTYREPAHRQRPAVSGATLHDHALICI